jgi:putative glutamine amidotransferase
VKRIGITQRVELIAAYGERRDCLDQQWTVLMEAAGLTVTPIPNGLTDVIAWAEACELDGLVLSGGNDLSHMPSAVNIAPERDRTEASLLCWAERNRIPVLAICRGMQMMHCWLGGELERIEGHVACRHPIRIPCGSTRLAGRDGELVNSFHSWGISRNSLASTVSELAWSEDGYVEAFEHNNLPWVGVMWHPERESPFSIRDLDLLRSQFLD